MLEKTPSEPGSRRRSNRQRTETTRTALIAAARKLFVERGYADTGTPGIVATAGVTRGALYHHFEDKAALFLTVAQEMAAEVAQAVSTQTRASTSALQALIDGADAYFDAMGSEGRARLLLQEAPSILVPSQLRQLSDIAGSEELQAGLLAAIQAAEASASAKRPRSGTAKPGAGARMRVTDQQRALVPLQALTTIVSAAFDRAALAIANGEPAEEYRAAIGLLLSSLAGFDQTMSCVNEKP